MEWRKRGWMTVFEPLVGMAAALLAVQCRSTESDGTPDDGSAEVASWRAEQKLLATLPDGVLDGGEDCTFGYSVALDGDTAIVGGGDNDQGLASGSAYVFVRAGGAWSVQQKLVASLPNGEADGGEAQRFGLPVALDGDTALIGSHAGAAYVFVRSGGVWSVQQKLTANLEAGDGLMFGVSVAVDGDTVIVGDPGDHEHGLESGAAYVLVRSGGAWSVQQKLTANLPDGTVDGAEYDSFGTSVALHGETAIVGSPYDDDLDYSSGSAYVFVRTDGVWTVQQKLTGTPPSETVEGDYYFGSSVALEGDTALVGSPPRFDSGAAHVFVRSDGVWSVQQRLVPGSETADSTDYDEFFGSSVDLGGNSAVIGRGQGDHGVASGSAYVFVRSDGVWNAQQRLTAVIPTGPDDGPAADGAEYDYFGSAVALDGDTVLVGSYFDDDQGENSGSAYVFRLE